MSFRRTSDHLNAMQVEAFLEGVLPARERARIEEHLEACAACAVEVQGWREVFDELNELGRLPRLTPTGGFAARVMGHVRVASPRDEAVSAGLDRLGHFAPSEGFAARVMDEVRVRGRHALSARILETALGWMGAGGHLATPTLQEYVEGRLSAVRAARVRGHADTCTSCRGEVEQYRKLVHALAELPHFDPTPDFGTRIMTAVRPAPTRAPRDAAPARALGRALAWVRDGIPRSRRTWATISGVAVTPMATAGVVLYTLASHPTLTPGALASFTWWKISDLALTTVRSLITGAVGSVPVFKAFTLLQTLAQAPEAVVGGLLVLSALTVGATWVLYRNLMVTPDADGRYAHAQI